MVTMSLASIFMCLGLIVRGIHGEVTGVDSPVPSPADLFSVPSYLLFMYATIQVHNSRAPRKNLDAWLDAAAVLASLIMVLWVAFYADYIVATNLTVSAKIVNGAYNVIVLITFATYIRITATPGKRQTVYYLLGGGGFVFFGTDLAANYSLLRGQGLFFSVALSPIAVGLLMAALRHPDAEELLKQDNEAEVKVGPVRLTVIALAIAAPTLVAVFGRDQPAWSLGFLLAASMILSLLVIVRVVRLLIDRRDTAVLDRKLAGEISTLAALDSKEAIIEELPRAVKRLVPRTAQVGFTFDEQNFNFALPDNLVSPQGAWLTLREGREPIAPSVERVVDSLLRDAGLVANSIAGLKAQTRQKSEAEANLRLAASERRFRALVERSTEVIMVLDAECRVSYITDAATKVLGLTPESVLGQSFQQYVHHNDVRAFDSAVARVVGTKEHSRFECRLIGSDDQPRLINMAMTDMSNVSEVDGIVINGYDVTEKRRLERDLVDAKTTDRLTLLPNRTGLIEALDVALRRATITGAPLALVSINIRDFKAVNDALGPVEADRVLIDCATAIRKVSRVDDTIARVGGDEFVVLMGNALSSADAVAASERIIEALADIRSNDGRAIQIKSYAGVVFSAKSDTVATDLLREVDIALSAAKEPANNDVVLFESDMALVVTERLELRSGIGPGLANGEFRLVYQPVLAISDRQIKSVEGLARWNHPRLGAVPPLTFIPLAEGSGQIEELGYWALRTACCQLAAWNEQGLQGFSASVNMSVFQLRQPDIVATVASIVEESGIDPTALTIEVTESVLIDDSDVVAGRMRALRALGILLAIDDFGTGYSSLSYLQRYEFDVLKIDKAFVDPLVDPDNHREREVVRSIIQLAKGLGAVTVAEGIEEQLQLDLLGQLGCDFAQGYLLHRPMEVDACTELLHQNVVV